MIDLIAEQASAPRVAEATTHAWEGAFNHIRDDAGFREAVHLLLQLGVAGRSDNPTEHLGSAGVELKSASSVVEVAMALSEAMERRMAGSRHRSDFGVLAERALVAAVTEHLQARMPTLLEPTSDDIGSAVKGLGREKAFGELSRSFFGRMANECLSYFLSKTLPAQVGMTRRFATTGQLAGFEDALRTHCAEASKIVETFGAESFSKHYHEGGGRIGRDTAEKFGWVGLEKMRRELAARGRTYAD